MKIMIAIPTAGFSRNDSFYDHLAIMYKPEGSVQSFARGQSPARGRNMLIQQAINHNCTHILFLDDDVSVKPDLIENLSRHDKDVVTALYLMRNFPHRPIIFDETLSDGSAKWHHLSDDETGLIEIVACGLGACLIKIEVFKALEQPWIRLGELEKDHWCDDIGFFRRVKLAGFRIYCDLDVQVGHMLQATVWPDRQNCKWLTTYDTKGSGTVSFIPPQPEEVRSGVS